MKRMLTMILTLVCVFSMATTIKAFAATSGGTTDEVIYVKTSDGFLKPEITLCQEQASYKYECHTLWTHLFGGIVKTKTTYGSYDVRVSNITTGAVEDYKWNNKTLELPLEENCEYKIFVDYNSQKTLNRNVQCQDGFTKAPSWKVNSSRHATYN